MLRMLRMSGMYKGVRDAPMSCLCSGVLFRLDARNATIGFRGAIGLI